MNIFLWADLPTREFHPRSRYGALLEIGMLIILRGCGGAQESGGRSASREGSLWEMRATGAALRGRLGEDIKEPHGRQARVKHADG